MSQSSPGESRAYGSRLRRALLTYVGQRSCADGTLERLVDQALLFGRERLEVMGVGEVREDQLVVGDIRVLLKQDLLGALHRRDVVHVSGDLGLDLRVVDEVDVLLCRERVRCPDGD